jgi:tyrosyl-DNA phosphodiesterase-1
MKCYFRYNISSDPPLTDSFSSSLSLKSHPNIELSWFVLTSANLSQAAWGVHEKGVKQIYVKSFEMGVLFLPNKIKTLSRSFSCTPYHPLLGVDPDKLLIKEEPVKHESGKKKETSLFYADLHNESHELSDNSPSIICFPIPFVIPPPRYVENVDYPWVWDYPFQTPDVHGRRRIV